MLNTEHTALPALQALPAPLLAAIAETPEQIDEQEFFFHDIRIRCQTNRPDVFALLHSMLGVFPRPAVLRSEALFAVFCYDHAEQFPLQLPRERRRTETLRLLTNTKLKYYTTRDRSVHYQSYVAQPAVNAAALSVIYPQQHIAIVQLERLEHYLPTFLRRYVFLLTLGELMEAYGFEPCHSAAITAPWDDGQGALIMGTSGSGKTTLSLGCMSIGCGLLGDDLLMLREDTQDARLYAHALSPEVSVRPATLDMWPTLTFLKQYQADEREKRYATIDHIRAGAMRFRTPIRLVLFPSLIDGPESILTPLSKAATLQELVEHCMGKNGLYAHTHERLFRLLSTLAEQTQGYRLAVTRGDNTGPQLVCSLFTGGTHE